MSYVTLEAQIEGGKVVVKEPEKLPETARALVTILETGQAGPGNFLETLETLQKHLQLDEKKAAEWMTTVRDASQVGHSQRR